MGGIFAEVEEKGRKEGFKEGYEEGCLLAKAESRHKLADMVRHIMKTQGWGFDKTTGFLKLNDEERRAIILLL